MFFADERQFAQIAEMIFQAGFRLELIISNRHPLHEITNPRWIIADEWKTNQKDLPEKFEPPICQVCQIAKATKRWPIDFILETKDICDNCSKLITESSLTEAFEHLCETDGAKLWDLTEDTTTEDLCETCYQIRAQGVKLLKLKDWTEAGGTKVVWLKLTLDFDALNTTLSELYEAYLNSLGLKMPKDNAIRFPVISEFLDDYNEFLSSVKISIINAFGEENIEFVANDLLCIRIEKLDEIMKALKLYNEEFNRFFPKFKETTSSPIQISIVAANSKYPFFEIWDMMANAKNDIFVVLVGRGQMKVKISDIELLIRAYEEGYEFPKSALEKLAKVAEISEKLAQLMAKDKSDKDYKTYEKMEHLGLDFRSLLTFAKIMEDR
jgi:hypothetical protein